MRKQIAAALEIAGITACAAAGFVVSTALGLAIAGVGCIVLGLSIERG